LIDSQPGSLPDRPEGLPQERSEAEIAAGLVGRVQRGDTRAEAEMVERYSRGLLFFLRRTTHDATLSEDLHQETFRIALERLRRDGLDDPEKLSGFLLRTARNLFLGHYRKRTRRNEIQEPEDAPEPSAAGPGQLDLLLRQEQTAAVQRLIRELPTDRDRQILLRFYVAEEEKDDICADLGLSSLHFNRVLFRARQRFKDLLESQAAHGPPPSGEMTG
jgi:RNA polymerase sigma-70 factor (ECF subfamily)